MIWTVLEDINDEKIDCSCSACTDYHTAENSTYEVDDRLVTARDWGFNNYNHNYQYDRIGNIKDKSESGYSGSRTLSYTYDYPVRPHAVKTVITDSPVYNDTQVNIVYNYDQKPRLIKRNQVDYILFTYDGSGGRVRKENLAIPQTTLYFGELYEKRGAVEIVHVFAGNRRVASIRSDGNHQYYHPNHLGSASIVTGQDGVWRERIEYHPFGTYLLDDKNPSYPAFPDANYTFNDQEDDDDIGLYNYGARLYDPVIGRFISPDRIVQAPENPQTLNRYSYCLNNPLIYTDPSGEFIFLALAVLVGSFSGAYEAHKAGENPWKGAMLGAIIGATSYYAGNVVGFYASELITPTVVTAANAGAVSAAQTVSTMVGGFAGGATAGALNAAAYGGNVWQAALYGGLTSAAAAGISVNVGDIQIFGSSAENWAANLGNRIFRSYLIGSAFGAAYAGITGGNVLEGAAYGGLTWAGGELANMAIGHGVGLIASGFSAPKFQDGAWIYEGNVSGAITFGNVILGETGFRSYRTAPYNTQESRLYRHEFGHVHQYQVLGPSFLPLYGGQFPIALIAFQNPFKFNLLENFFLRGAPTTHQIWK